jgi:HEAT repeat protein
MPLIKRDAPALPAADPAIDQSASTAIADLASSEADVRWRAARALGLCRMGVTELAAALALENEPRVREAIMTALMRIGDEASVMALLPCLRSQDAGLRTAAIEALQSLPGAISPFLVPLLSDNDADVRILATELTRNLPAGEATDHLSNLLTHEQEPNVCGAAVEVLAEVGTKDAIPALQSCARRFSSIPFLTFAVSTAIARISNTES